MFFSGQVRTGNERKSYGRRRKRPLQPCDPRATLCRVQWNPGGRINTRPFAVIFSSLALTQGSKKSWLRDSNNFPLKFESTDFPAWETRTIAAVQTTSRLSSSSRGQMKSRWKTRRPDNLYMPPKFGYCTCAFLCRSQCCAVFVLPGMLIQICD